MQTSSGDGASTPRKEVVEESPAQTPVEETVVETTPKNSTATAEEHPPSGKAAEDEEGEEEQTTAPPRKERSVVFSSRPQAASEILKEESARLPSVRGTRIVAETPQPIGSFSFIRRLTTELFNIPFGFFQSRAEVRTWGEEELVDPSVQPRYSSTAQYGWGSLPGYPKSSLFFFEPRAPGTKQPQFYSLAPKGGYRPAPGVPLLQFVPGAVQIPQATPLDPPSYNWADLKETRMDTVPYVNARMTPVDPTGMYVAGNYMVGYPYGVPAVEENEGNPLMNAIPDACTCKFLCW